MSAPHDASMMDLGQITKSRPVLFLVNASTTDRVLPVPGSEVMKARGVSDRNCAVVSWCSYSFGIFVSLSI